jgi:hypothetical protein
MKKGLNSWKSLSSYKFEQLIMDILKRGSEDLENIRRLGGPGDRGRDIIFDKRISVLPHINNYGKGIVCCYHPKGKRFSRRKIISDLDNAMQHKINFVFFATSANILPSDMDWFNGIKDQYKFHVSFIDHDDIASFLSQPENDDLLKKYFPRNPNNQFLTSTGDKKRRYLEQVKAIWEDKTSSIKGKLQETQTALKNIFNSRDIPSELKLLYLKNIFSLTYGEDGKCIVNGNHFINNVSNAPISTEIYRIGGITPMPREQIKPQLKFKRNMHDSKCESIPPRVISVGQGWMDMDIQFSPPLMPGESTEFTLNYRWDYPSSSPLGLRWNVFIVDFVCIESTYLILLPVKYNVSVLGIFRKAGIWDYKEETNPLVTKIKKYKQVEINVKLPRMNEEIHTMIKVD